MRTDKIIEIIISMLFSGKDIELILQNKVPIKLKFISILIYLKKIILLLLKWKFKWLTNIENIQEYNIYGKEFDPKFRKKWISWIARLKNWDDFLELCLLEASKYLDEIVLLVDQNSTDKTNEICIELSIKYPKKFKYFPYEYEVYPWNHPKYHQTPDNSVHALSYFYNYAVSKSTYTHMMKLDDDMLCIWNIFREELSKIRQENWNYFYALPQINLEKNSNNFRIPSKYLHSWIAWLFWDHGVFKVSNRTYFFNDIWCENLIMPYRIKYLKVSFFHLKLLKKNKWMWNYEWYWNEYIKKVFENSNHIKLPEKFEQIINIYLN